MRWVRVTKFDPRAAALADRHYTRQTVGSPQFMPSGRTVVLLTEDELAVWGTLWSVGAGTAWATHDWPYAWNCSIFRNEGPHLSSDLIREAVAATRALWGEPHERGGFVTFVDRDRVRPKRDPGRCFLRAGFRYVGETRSGKVVLLLRPDEFPPADPPLGGDHPRATIPLLPDFGLDDPVRTKRETFGGGLRRGT